MHQKKHPKREFNSKETPIEKERKKSANSLQKANKHVKREEVDNKKELFTSSSSKSDESSAEKGEFVFSTGMSCSDKE